jgi:hypothetical protein
MAEAKWRSEPFRFFTVDGASAKYHNGVTTPRKSRAIN